MINFQENVFETNAEKDFQNLEKEVHLLEE